MDARMLRSWSSFLRRAAAARALGALLAAAALAAVLAPSAGAEPFDQRVEEGAVPVILDAAMSDGDFDGLSDLDEAAFGTDPYLFDTDDDLVADGDELYVYGTTPTVSDTDEDGLSDGNEVFGLRGYRTDPTRFDTDGDGIGDGAEVFKRTNPLDASSR